MTIQDYLDASDKSSKLEEIINKAKKLNTDNPAILRFEDEYVTNSQEAMFDKAFAGTPLVIKDNILLEWTISSFGSKISEEYVAPYSATVVTKLEEAWFLTIGKATMDEFAMGGSGEHSPFPVPHNVEDQTRVAWGSSSGSAVAVASGQVAVALGTDTGGSVRQPAAFNGIYGLKPSYGAVSRYGVQAMASSFDQVGVFGTTPQDVETLFKVIAGKDPRDATTQDYEFTSTLSWLEGVKFGIPKQFFAEGLDQDIESKIRDVLSWYESQWVELVELDFPLIDAGVSAYYTLISAEISTNLARFDGLKYGQQLDTHDFSSHEEYLQTVRKEFGEEVKRRILMGTHVLSAREYEWLYVKAQQIRTQITEHMLEQLAKVDVIVWPTTPVVPWKLGEKTDPVSAYLADSYTVIANLTWLPALSMPVGRIDKDGQSLPVGFQIMWSLGSEITLLALAAYFETNH